MKDQLAFKNSFVQSKMLKLVKIISAVVFILSLLGTIYLIISLVSIIQVLILFINEEPSFDIASLFSSDMIPYTMQFIMIVIFMLCIPIIAVFSFMLAFLEDKSYSDKLILTNLLILSFVFTPASCFLAFYSSSHSLFIDSFTIGLLPLIISLVSSIYYLYLYCRYYERKAGSIYKITKNGQVTFALLFLVLSLPYLAFDLCLGSNLINQSNLFQTNFFSPYFLTSTYAFLFGGIYFFLIALFRKNKKISSILSHIFASIVVISLIIIEYLFYYFSESHNVPALTYFNQIFFLILFISSIILSYKIIDKINLELEMDIKKHPDFYEARIERMASTNKIQEIEQ